MASSYKNKPRNEAAELLECFIAENKLAPNQKLPSERALCEMWGFNRTTLRSAIRKLVVEGRLYSKSGSGTFVAEPKLVRNLQDLELMPNVAKRAGRVLGTRVISQGIIESNKHTSKKLRVMLGHPVFQLSRLRIVEDVPAIIELSYLDAKRFPDIEKIDFNKAALYHTLETEYGCKVTHGEEKVSITYTSEDEAELLAVPPDSAVFYLSGVANDENGWPTDYFKSISRHDKVCFYSVLR